jgi:nicotinate-nucleotide adenylyltransferase
MEIGLYFGSFNPLHVGHLIIANHVLNTTEIEKIWIVVSPQNPFKKEKDLLKESKRLTIVKKSIAGDKRLFASDVEFQLSKPSFSYNTLSYLKKNHPQHRYSLIMGSDSFQNLDKWRDFESIIEQHRLFIYPRPGFDISNTIKARIEILDAPMLDISSTAIRALIKAGKSIRYLVPDKARMEIEKNKYYRK